MDAATGGAEITVRGEGVRRGEAERAVVTVTSHWQAATPRETASETTKAHESAVSQARAFVEAGAAESWHADRVWMSHHREWAGDGQPERLVYSASASVGVEFIDFDALGRWLGELGVHNVYEVGGIEWKLTEETRRDLARGAREDAVADAVERAGDYARAASQPEPRLVRISEPKTISDSPVPFTAKREMAAVMSDSSGGAVTLRSGSIEVEALIEATFVTSAAAPQV